jgi:phosphate transport system substrate-binding protein
VRYNEADKEQYMIKKLVASIAMLTAAVIIFSACASGGKTSLVTAAGSSALMPLVQEGANEFMKKNIGAVINVEGGGSGAGLSKVAAKSCDIGNSDIAAEDMLTKQQASSLGDHRVCAVGFAIVVSGDVTVTNLTTQQLFDIFTGKIRNWKDVGGSGNDIVILKRPSTSGTRAVFDKYVLNGAEEADGIALIEESSEMIKAALSVNKGAVSYLALPYIDSSVKTVKLNGVSPTAENIKSGDYTLWSYEHMYTNGEASGTTKAFLDFIMSPGFATEITKLGYIPVSEMKVTR